MGEEEEEAMTRYEAEASSLPTCRGLGGAPYRKYGDFLYPAHLMPSTLAMRDAFVARPTDVLLATMPKSGTTWLKALVFAVAHRDRHAPDDDTRHPLLGSSPHDLVPFLHSLYEDNHRQDQDQDPPRSPSARLEAMPAPRILAAHAPFSLLRASVAGCRVVYLCRDPKDALVSYWHYIPKVVPQGHSLPPFHEAFQMYCDGVSPLGPVWDHMAEYWKASVARPEAVLFLRYEQLHEDTVGSVKRLAEFLGCPL